MTINAESTASSTTILVSSSTFFSTQEVLLAGKDQAIIDTRVVNYRGLAYVGKAR
jgi:hypothetical protein